MTCIYECSSEALFNELILQSIKTDNDIKELETHLTNLWYYSKSRKVMNLFFWTPVVSVVLEDLLYFAVSCRNKVRDNHHVRNCFLNLIDSLSQMILVDGKLLDLCRMMRIY